MNPYKKWLINECWKFWLPKEKRLKRLFTKYDVSSLNMKPTGSYLEYISISGSRLYKMPNYDMPLSVLESEWDNIIQAIRWQSVASQSSWGSH